MSINTKKSKYYFRSYSRWLLKDLKFFWLYLLSILLPLFFVYFLSFEEEGLIRLGAFLQVVGILSIFYEIHKVKQQFKSESFKNTLKAWIRKRPKNHSNTFYIEPEGIYVGIKPLDITLTTVPHWDDQKSIEDNVKNLIKSIEQNKYQIEKTKTDLKSEMVDNYNNLHEKVHISQSLITKLEKSIENNATGGIRITLVSSLWLLMGVLFATIPKDIILLLNLL
tara:strand:- start:140 stop:808 length:669 start_codon:yes stop_codon:yes gene_type:complete